MTRSTFPPPAPDKVADAIAIGCIAAIIAMLIIGTIIIGRWLGP